MHSPDEAAAKIATIEVQNRAAQQAQAAASGRPSSRSAASRPSAESATSRRRPICARSSGSSSSARSPSPRRPRRKSADPRQPQGDDRRAAGGRGALGLGLGKAPAGSGRPQARGRPEIPRSRNATSRRRPRTRRSSARTRPTSRSPRSSPTRSGQGEPGASGPEDFPGAGKEARRKGDHAAPRRERHRQGVEQRRGLAARLSAGRAERQGERRRRQARRRDRQKHRGDGQKHRSVEKQPGAAGGTAGAPATSAAQPAQPAPQSGPRQPRTRPWRRRSMPRRSAPRPRNTTCRRRSSRTCSAKKAASSRTPRGRRSPRAVASGARSAGQFMPEEAKKYGVDRNDDESWIGGAAHYLSDLYAQKGSWAGALGDYRTRAPGSPAMPRRKTRTARRSSPPRMPPIIAPAFARGRLCGGRGRAFGGASPGGRGNRKCAAGGRRCARRGRCKRDAGRCASGRRVDRVGRRWAADRGNRNRTGYRDPRLARRGDDPVGACRNRRRRAGARNRTGSARAVRPNRPRVIGVLAGPDRAPEGDARQGRHRSRHGFFRRAQNPRGRPVGYVGELPPFDQTPPAPEHAAPVLGGSQFNAAGVAGAPGTPAGPRCPRRSHWGPTSATAFRCRRCQRPSRVLQRQPQGVGRQADRRDRQGRGRQEPLRLNRRRRSKRARLAVGPARGRRHRRRAVRPPHDRLGRVVLAGHGYSARAASRRKPAARCTRRSSQTTRSPRPGLEIAGAAIAGAGVLGALGKLFGGGSGGAGGRRRAQASSDTATQSNTTTTDEKYRRAAGGKPQRRRPLPAPLPQRQPLPPPRQPAAQRAPARSMFSAVIP